MMRRFSFLTLSTALLILLLSGSVWAGGGGGGFGGGGGGFSGGSGGGAGVGVYTALDPRVVIAVMGILLVLLLTADRLMSLFVIQCRLVNIVLVLRHGERYAPELDRLTLQANFEAPETRARALRGILKLIRPEDIVESFARTEIPVKDETIIGQAQSLWERQMQEAGIDPKALNYAASGRTVAHINRLSPESIPSRNSTETFCLLGLIATMNGLRIRRENSRTDAADVLRSIHSLKPEAFYFYYKPSADETVTRGQAEETFNHLRFRSKKAGFRRH